MAREEASTLQRRHIPYIALGALALAGPFILWNTYLRDLLVIFVIFAILALSLNIIMGYMGQFSFGHQAFFGLGAYTAAMLSVKLGLNPWLGFIAGIALATAFGYAVGLAALRAARGVYLAIVTYGIAAVIWVYCNGAVEFTGGPSGIYPIPPLAVPGLVFDSETSFYYLALGFLVFTVYLITRWLRSPFGRAVIAIRENEELANSTGIHSYRYYVMAFTLASALAALAGVLYAYYIGVVNPVWLSVSYLVKMLVMVIIGGTGTIGGPIFGAFFYVFVLDLLPVGSELALVIFGAILFSCIVFLPRGIFPYLESAISRRFGQRRSG